MQSLKVLVSVLLVVLLCQAQAGAQESASEAQSLGQQLLEAGGAVDSLSQELNVSVGAVEQRRAEAAAFLEAKLKVEAEATEVRAAVQSMKQQLTDHAVNVYINSGNQQDTIRSVADLSRLSNKRMYERVAGKNISDTKKQLELKEKELTSKKADMADLEARANEALMEAEKTLEKVKQDLEKQSKIKAAVEKQVMELLQSFNAEGEVISALGLPVNEGRLSSGFGFRHHPVLEVSLMHSGVDFAARSGAPIFSSEAGTVVIAGSVGGYGNYTCVSHSRGLSTCYAHQSEILVKVGDTVSRGQLIGLVGSTGRSTGPHLHYEVRVGGSPVDPLPYLGIAS